MSFRQGVLAGLTVITLCCLNASAQENPFPAPSQSRPCIQADFKGVYVLMAFNEMPRGPESRWRDHFRHEYLAFYTSQKGPSPYYNTVTTMQEIQTADQASRTLGPATPNKKYTLSDTGMLYLYRGDTIGYSYQCITSLSDAGIFKMGDIVLTGYASQGTNQVYKFYRHWY